MRHSRCRIRRDQHDIHRLLALALLVPPVVESRLVRLALACQLPVLVRALGVPVPDQASPDLVPSYILHPPVVQLLDEARELHVFHHDCGAEIVPLARPEEGHERLSAIGEEQMRSELQRLIG